MGKGAAQGYLKDGKPDVGWWLDQIRSGEKFRERYAYEDKWPIWKKYYRNEWDDGVLPKNIFFPMLRSMVPRVYFRNPRVSIRPKIPGFMNMAFAQLLNRIMNKLIRESGLKHEMKDVAQDAWMTGSGHVKLGFGNLHGGSAADVFSAAPVGDRGERYEYDAKVTAGMPWAKRVGSGNIVWPDGTRRIKDARWVAEFIQRPRDDVIRDPRFKNTEGLRGSSVAGEQGAINQAGKKIGSAVDTTLEMVDLYEVRDFKFRRVFIIAPNAGHTKKEKNSGKIILDIQDDRMQDRELPYRKVGFNPDSDVCWDVPFAQELETSQLELNEIRTQSMKHRRAAMVKLAAQKGAMTDTEMAKLLSEDASAVVEVNGSPRNVLHTLQTGYIPNDMQVAEQLVVTDVREAMGMSRNEMGEFQTRRGDTSAEEARNVHESAEVRLNEMRDEMADLLVGVVEEWIEIIFDFWTEEILVDVVGPGGIPIWVQVNPSELRFGRYTVEVDPESSAPTSRQDREQQALIRYQVLKDNPLIAPDTLTKYLLTEMEGVELDDLLRQMPPVPGAGGQTVGPAGLAGILQQGITGPNAGGAGRSLLGTGA